MRVLHIATLVSPDGAYGGPIRVATNQLQALRQTGVEVHFAGAYRGPTRPQTVGDQIPATLFRGRPLIPGLGFAGMAAPGLGRWLRRNVIEFDIVHIHLARDFVTLPAARIALGRRVPVIVQCHGMIDPSTHPLSFPVDSVLTRPVLRASSNILCLTPYEQRMIHQLQPGLNRMTIVPNGVPMPKPPDSKQPRPVPEFLFLSRLHPRKRPGIFVQAMAALKARGVRASFALVGPDGGEAAVASSLIDQFGLRSWGSWEGPISPEATGERMSRADVLVLPSVQEPFPMVVLEAMAHALPVIVTTSCGLADFVSEVGAGIVVEESLESLIEAMADLAVSPDRRAEMGRLGRQAVKDSYAMESIAARLLEVYRTAAEEQR